MRRLIKANFPQHGIVGEEFGDERADAEYARCSTRSTASKSFISGLPIWGTLIALMRHGVPAFGMMHQPYIGERFTGDGGAATYTGPPASANWPCAAAPRWPTPPCSPPARG